MQKSNVFNDTNNQLLSKVSWRILPLLFCSYICAYLDRINIGFASKNLKDDLNFSDSVYGLGAGIFFLGYALFEIPSNVIMEKVGARRWIARIMITWGIISGAMAFVNSPFTFYILRFFLGVAEAGFFPGIILYLTYWFPPSQRGKSISRFMTAIPLSGLIGAPISGMLLDMDGIASLHGWQWLFILEALPSVLMGLYIFFFLPDKPANAYWLNEFEKKHLSNALTEEELQIHSTTPKLNPLLAISSLKVWYICLIYFFQVTGLYGIGLWLPDLLQSSTHVGNIQTGLLTAIPFLAGALSMIIWGWNSDRLNERKWHLFLGNLLGSTGFVIAGLRPDSLPFALLGITIASMGVHATFGPFWALKTTLLAPGIAAVGIALINSMGNLGGFMGPSLTGFLKQSTGSLSWGLILYASTSFMAALMILFLKTTPIQTSKK
ncbi:MAG: hypothetical protein RL179_2727 [Planctomycetota bacterium]